jgi:hypothetical protein
MDPKIETILTLAERVILHAEHGVPQDVEVTNRLKQLIEEVRKEHGIAPPISQSLPGRA